MTRADDLAAAWDEGAAAAMRAVHDRITGPLPDDAFPLPPNPHRGPKMVARMTMTSPHVEYDVVETDGTRRPATDLETAAMRATSPFVIRVLGAHSLAGEWTRLHVWSDGLVTVKPERPSA